MLAMMLAVLAGCSKEHAGTMEKKLCRKMPNRLQRQRRWRKESSASAASAGP